MDPEVSTAIEMELDRERENVNLIASENYSSMAVLAAQGFDPTRRGEGEHHEISNI
ncbi:MAG: hypothetical protein KJ625_05640 [Actinobacteria bacterium]|nr:hypothetical protein [Actinomycetota bacterium]